MADSEVFAVLQEGDGLSLAEIGTGQARRHRKVPAGPPPATGRFFVRAFRHEGGFTVAADRRDGGTPLFLGAGDGPEDFRPAPEFSGRTAQAAGCHVLSDGAVVALARSVPAPGRKSGGPHMLLLRRGAERWEEVPLPDGFRPGGAVGARAGDFLVHGARQGGPAGGGIALLRVREGADGTPLAAPLDDFTAWGPPRLALRDRLFPFDDLTAGPWAGEGSEAGAEAGTGLVLGTTMCGDTLLDEVLFAVDFRNRSWAVAQSRGSAVITSEVTAAGGIHAVTDGGWLWEYRPAPGARWRRSGTLRRTLRGLAARGAAGGGPIPRDRLRVPSAARLGGRLVVALARAGEGGLHGPVEAVVATAPDGTDPRVLYRAAPDGPRVRCLVGPTP